jgi:hypothetical protein
MKAPLRQPLHLQENPKCLAKTRRQTLCQSPAMKNGRCRIHGGASPGAPRGERNGQWKHGRYSLETIELRRAIRELMRHARETVASI